MTTVDVRQTQLFVYDGVIAHQTLLERVVHSPVRSRLNPIFCPEQPWEMPSITFIAGVVRDDVTGTFRAWYVTYPRAYPGYASMLCVAISSDGLHWERPALDYYRDLVGGPSNVLFASPHRLDGPTVCHDPRDAERPWKLVFYQQGSVFVAHSRDGWQWSMPSATDPPLLPGFGDRTTALYDATADEPYVVFSRDSTDQRARQLVRAIYRAGSRDARTLSAAPQLVLRPDLEDGPDIQHYQMSSFRYGSTYLGLLERFHTGEPPYSDIELTCSRDSRTWTRVRPRTVFFGPPPHGRELGAFDFAVATPANSPPILHDGALWMYYYGGPSFHGDRFLTHARCIGLAKLRPDGFASLRAGRREGMVTTRVFTWPGGRLSINGRVLGGNLWPYTGLEGSDGWVRLEVLDAAGAVIPGYARDQCGPLFGDAVRYEPTWSDAPQNLDALIGQRIALRFLLRSADLFAFRTDEVTSGTVE